MLGCQSTVPTAGGQVDKVMYQWLVAKGFNCWVAIAWGKHGQLHNDLAKCMSKYLCSLDPFPWTLPIISHGILQWSSCCVNKSMCHFTNGLNLCASQSLGECSLWNLTTLYFLNKAYPTQFWHIPGMLQANCLCSPYLAWAFTNQRPPNKTIY